MTARLFDLPSPLYNRPSKVARAYEQRYGVPTGSSASYIADGPIPRTVWIYDGTHAEPCLVDDPTHPPTSHKALWARTRRVRLHVQRARALQWAIRQPHVPHYHDDGTLAALVAAVTSPNNPAAYTPEIVGETMAAVVVYVDPHKALQPGTVQIKPLTHPWSGIDPTTYRVEGILAPDRYRM